MKHAARVARTLLDLQAVIISPHTPFTWASGLRAPIYCDNRLIISDVKARALVTDAFVALIGSNKFKPNVIAGTATAGIPHAAWVADRLELPMVYVRNVAKGHGKHKQIEGRLPDDARVLLIEDLISTGGSSIRAARCLAAEGAHIISVLAIFQYGLAKASQGFAAAGFPFASITDLSHLLAQEGINHEQSQSLKDWQDDPQAWSHRHV